MLLVLDTLSRVGRLDIGSSEELRLTRRVTSAVARTLHIPIIPNNVGHYSSKLEEAMFSAPNGR